MINTFKKRLIVQRNPAQIAYEHAMGLKENEIFEAKFHECFLAFKTYLKQNYPEIGIDTPKAREKSPNSLRGKIRRLEIERLAKLYAIEGISNKQEKQFLHIVKELVEEDCSKHDSIEDKKQQTEEMMQELVTGKIEEMDVMNIAEAIAKQKINAHSKTALLRILKTRVEKSNRIDKQAILEKMENMYGEQAAIRENREESNLLRSENIEEIKNNPDELERLHHPAEYLKAKDIRAMRFVFTSIPENFETQNPEILENREKIKKAKTEQERSIYKDAELIAFEKEFANRLLNDTAFLDSLGIELMPNAYKHKSKSNGYIADHIKFYVKDNPSFIFELQLRSIYREEMAKNGEAAHSKRAGKERILPEYNNDQQFFATIKDKVPQYSIIKENQVHKCSWLENVMGYYQDELDFQNPEDIKMLKTVQEIEKEETNSKGRKR